MRVVFLGTPEFAVPSLAALVRRFDVTLVLTQPDRPKGRGRHLAEPPVKTLARSLGLPVLQPETLDEGGMRPHFEQAGAEALVVVAYGLKIPDWLIRMHPRGAVNVHGSLLPAYRGAAPVNRAIVNGDAETGVTTMLLASRMDAGPVLMQRRTPIGPAETAGEVTARLAELGAGLLVVTLDGLASGIVQPRAQDEALATFAPKLKKEDGLIDWTRGAREIVNLVRGVNPWPGAYTHLDGKPLKIWKAAVAARPAAATGSKGVPSASAPSEVRPGTVLAASLHEGLLVACGNGEAVALLSVQTEGKKPLTAPEFLRGRALPAGTILS
ncbi:MAG: methionyl-tRNA formyltransferase [Candidatus Methylomirabilia bacterium]